MKNFRVIKFIHPSTDRDLCEPLESDPSSIFFLGFPGQRNVNYYACCKEPYIDLVYTLHIRRRKLYYVVNLIMPCAILSALTMVAFLIPPDAGEKVSFGMLARTGQNAELLLNAISAPARPCPFYICTVQVLLVRLCFI